MTATRPLKVFLCHASADKPNIRKLFAYLKKQKIDAWLDAEKLLGGQSWRAEIPKAIKSSDAIVVCLSKNSVNKEGYVQKEIKFALDKADEMPAGRIFIIPAKLEECDLPDELADYHCVSLFEEDGYRRLMRSLRARAAQIETVAEISDTPYEEEIEPLEPKDNSIGVGGDVSGANIIMGNNNVIHVMPPSVVQASSLNETPKAKVTQSSSPKEPIAPRKSQAQSLIHYKFWGIGVIAFALLALAVWELSSILASPKPTETSPAPTKTPVPATSTLIPTPTLGVGSTMISEKDGMTLVYVPAGEFTMGSNNSDQSDEKPEYQVDLSAFWIDQTEVTNSMYAKCIADNGACTPPSDTNHFNNPTYANHPVAYVNWNQANAYCSWAGRQLPSEAQWEKTARGTDARTYPWGNQEPNKDLLNYNLNIGDTTKVGSYESGKSFYGAYDMAGNVWEWVNDWYSDTYYQSSPSSNPLGPSSGQYRVLRGGSWYYDDYYARSAFRNRNDPASTSDNNGFRCARSLSVP